jgi:hypothetical protein
MNQPVSPAAGSALRQRFVEDMTVRGFSEKTRRYYIRIVAGFAAFLGCSPDTTTAEDIRRFQGLPPPSRQGNLTSHSGVDPRSRPR